MTRRIGAVSCGMFGALIARDRSGAERLRVRRSWWSWRRHVVTRGGVELTRIVRERRGLFSTALEAQGVRVELPRDCTLDDRRLLLATAILLDLDRA